MSNALLVEWTDDIYRREWTQCRRKNFNLQLACFMTMVIILETTEFFVGTAVFSGMIIICVNQILLQVRAWCNSANCHRYYRFVRGVLKVLAVKRLRLCFLSSFIIDEMSLFLLWIFCLWMIWRFLNIRIRAEIQKLQFYFLKAITFFSRIWCTSVR